MGVSKRKIDDTLPISPPKPKRSREDLNINTLGSRKGKEKEVLGKRGGIERRKDNMEIESDIEKIRIKGKETEKGKGKGKGKRKGEGKGEGKGNEMDSFNEESPKNEKAKKKLERGKDKDKAVTDMHTMVGIGSNKPRTCQILYNRFIYTEHLIININIIFSKYDTGEY